VSELAEKGFEALLILLITWLALRLARGLTGRMERRATDEQGETLSEREQRTRTLAQLLNSVFKGVIAVTAVLMLLNLLIPIGPLLAGVGVLGLAFSFGAQSLVRDVISGFFILAENQFSVGDIIEVQGRSGVVERMTLRMVAIRDVEGVLHIVPNGAIDMVSNKTRGWARAVVDVGVAYRENVDQVIGVVQSVAQGLWDDPEWRPRLVGQPIVWGVQALAESSVNVRLVADTHPGKQWAVKREILRRLKNRFDQEGIEIPFPQRTLHFSEVDMLRLAAGQSGKEGR
jgi:small conductance mechanosensitive channel